MEKLTEVKQLLCENRASLLVGAGFNYGLLNQNEKEIPLGNNLKKIIINDFLNINEESEQYSRHYKCSLKQLCSSATRKENSKGEFKLFLIDLFSGFEPDIDYDILPEYNWNGIFSTNIDDVIEKIYKRNKLNLLVQNSVKINKKRSRNHDQVLFKLHGCINNFDGDFVFSSSEYLSSIGNNLYDYRFMKLFTSMEENPLVIIGSEFDENNIDYYLENIANYSGRNAFNKIILVNPNISVPLEDKIEEHNGIHLKMSTKNFLKFMNDEKLKYKGRNHKDRLLTSMGCEDYLMIKNHLKAEDKYTSRLWEGYPPKYEDIEYEYSFKRHYINVIKNLIDESFEKQLWISLNSTHFVGMSTIYQELFKTLSNAGYNVISYNNRSNFTLFDITEEKLTEIYNNQPIILMLEDSADYFIDIIKDIFERINSIDICVITTSNKNTYRTNRLYLIHEITKEIKINDQIHQDDYTNILSVLESKGVKHAITSDNIKRHKDILSLVYSITESSQIINRYSENIFSFKEKNYNLYRFLLKLSILYKLEISGYLKSFVKQSHPFIEADLNSITEIVSNELNEFRIRNLPISESIFQSATKKEITDVIIEFLKSISGFLSENERSYWRNISYKILKVRNLKQLLNLNNNEIFKIIESIKSQYIELSYFWMQLGKLHQANDDFAQAHIALREATTISGHSYQVKHALASNYLMRAINEDNSTYADGYFKEGKKIFLALIENSPYQYNKSFSVHSYVKETLEYYKKFNLKPSTSELRYMIDLLIERYVKDYDDERVRTLLRIIYNRISESEYEGFSLTGKDLSIFKSVNK